ncbi:MAG TPA: hypothetical protein VFC56_07410 [Stellaceae bacterium]|nr:hypothetical protein [Stellaceae bacterium]
MSAHDPFALGGRATIRLENGHELSFLRAFRALEPRKRQAALSAILRLRDGQPMEECFTEYFVEIGLSLAVARQSAVEVIQKSVADPVDWRRLLD